MLSATVVLPLYLSNLIVKYPVIFATVASHAKEVLLAIVTVSVFFLDIQSVPCLGLAVIIGERSKV